MCAPTVRSLTTRNLAISRVRAALRNERGDLALARRQPAELLFCGPERRQRWQRMLRARLRHRLGQSVRNGLLGLHHAPFSPRRGECYLIQLVSDGLNAAVIVQPIMPIQAGAGCL